MSRIPLCGDLGVSLRRWRLHRKALRLARYRSELATERAKVGLAAYRAKAQIEWDLKWASPLDKTWRDEILIAIWSVPIIGVFIPGPREVIAEGFKLLASFDPQAPTLFMYGWAIIFAATFGIKQGKSLFMPGRLAGLVEAIGKVPDQVPEDVARAAQDAVTPDLDLPPTTRRVSSDE
jgi:hypothetical protein